MHAGKSPHRAAQLTPARIRSWLQEITDPEIPVLNLAELGILREVHCRKGRVEVVITPTYSGCPAMHTIEQAIVAVLQRHGVADFNVTTRISPPWTSDWITPAGRRKLLEYGIAPPARPARRIQRPFADGPRVACPRCGSRNTVCLSEFGSTACKALHKCEDCLEPFDSFKCI